MSTKNLARTVIEGGRRYYNRYARRHSNATERSWERVTSHKLLTASELDDVLYRPREKVFRDFSDKLGPAERWLRSQSGRPWSKVRSELFTLFDIRTTAGRHLLFDHVLKSIAEGRRVHRRHEFWIDTHGILRAHERRRKPPRKLGI